MNSSGDETYSKAVAVIERALNEVAGLFAETTGSEQMVIGDFVLVSEWSSLNGDRFVTRYMPDGMPPWRRNGLLDWAAQDWGDES